MKAIALIPARHAATRFHAKLMQHLGSKTVIRHTYENTRNTGLFDDVFVITDHDIIYNEIKSHGGKVIKSNGDFASGSDRIADAVKDLETDIVINVQGDEPFVNAPALKNLIAAFEDDSVEVATLMCPINKKEDIENPSWVKVVADMHKRALYFSRSPIPYLRNKDSGVQYWKHIGIYGFRKKTLMDFTRWERSPLEKAESLEQLRYIEHGVSIRMVETDEAPFSIDTPEDLEKAKAHLKQLQESKKINTQTHEI